MAVVVPFDMSTHCCLVVRIRARQEGNFLAIICYGLNGTKSNGVGRGDRKNVFSGAVCLRGAALDSLQRKGNFTFTKSKMPLSPSFPSFSISVWFEVLGQAFIYLFLGK